LRTTPNPGGAEIVYEMDFSNLKQLSQHATDSTYDQAKAFCEFAGTHVMADFSGIGHNSVLDLSCFTKVTKIKAKKQLWIKGGSFLTSHGQMSESITEYG